MPMGLANSLDIFQEKLGDLFADLEILIAYIDYLLIFNKGSWEDHLSKLEIFLSRLQNTGLTVNKKILF